MSRARPVTRIPEILTDLRKAVLKILDDQDHSNAVRGTTGIARLYLDEIDDGIGLARRRMTDALPGARTSAWDSSGHGTILDDEGVPMPSVSDPTGEAAIRPDPATSDRYRLVGALAEARHHARHLAGRTAPDELVAAHRTLDHIRNAAVIVGRYARTVPTVIDRDATTTPPGCVSCARDGDHWSPIERTVTLLDGSRVPMCDWCRKRSAHTGTMPTRAEVAAHHQGRRVPVPRPT